MTSATSSSVDQAEGLRNIFGAELCTVVCLASTLDVDSTILLGHGTAHALKNLGHKVLLVDEFALSDRKTMSGFLYPTRYDLGQVFSNSVSLDKSLRQIEDTFWYATSAKLRTQIEARFARYPQLDERLIAAGIDLDYILLPTNHPTAQVIAYYGSNVKRIITTSPEDSSLSKALAIIRQMTILQIDEPMHILMVGGQDEAQGHAAFEKLKEAAQKALHQDIELTGWIGAIKAKRVVIDPDDLSFEEPQSGPTEEFILPNDFFKTISAKITV
jgi:hypothetical protein